jgi:hypothetical protein
MMTPERIAELRKRYREWADFQECLDELELVQVQLRRMRHDLTEARDDADGWESTAKRLASEAGASCSDLLEHDESEDG